MNSYNSFDVQTISVPAKAQRGKIDLVVLKYMARKLVGMLQPLEQPAPTMLLPLCHVSEEHHGRSHRIVICSPQELLEAKELFFVGFVSKRAQVVAQSVVKEISHADELMLTEIGHIPGLLSYSSLGLRMGNWFNLVIFREAEIKAHLQASSTHQHAAYHLSLDYYEWIRLHNGILPGGLLNKELVLSSTRYYTFPGTQQLPTVRELTYARQSDV